MPPLTKPVAKVGAIQTMPTEEATTIKEISERFCQTQEQMLKMVEGLAAKYGNNPVVAKESTIDESKLTTPEEMKRYEQWIDSDFVKIDPAKKQQIETGFFFRLIHITPVFGAAGAGFLTKFYVEKFKRVKQPDGSMGREIQPEGSGFIEAKDFEKNYKAVMVQNIEA